MNFQEYKRIFNIESNEYDDLENGYCVTYMFSVVFMTAVMCEDLFGINSI